MALNKCPESVPAYRVVNRIGMLSGKIHFTGVLRNYVENQKVEAFVIGMPLQKDGSTSDIEKNILEFIKDLKKTFPSYPVYRQDERYTSKISSKVILESGIKKNKRKNKRLIDKISATLILQSFLEHKFKNS